jgi:hypothetical protein
VAACPVAGSGAQIRRCSLNRSKLLNDFLYHEVLQIDRIDCDAKNHVATRTTKSNAAPFCPSGFYDADLLNPNLRDGSLTLGAFTVS